MALTQQARTTTTVSSDQLAIELGDRINMLEPSAQPLSVFSRKAFKKRTGATKFSWMEDTTKARYDSVDGAVSGTPAAGTVSAVLVDHGAYFAQYDQVLNTRTGEQYRVHAVVSNTLSLVRGIGSTVAAILDNDELVIIGTAQPENDRSKPARSENPSKVTNFTQISRTPYESSGSLMASDFQVNPADWPHQARKGLIEHTKDIELTLLHSRKSADASGDAELRTTGGAFSFISSHQTDAGGDLSEAEFNAFMAQVMRYGSSSKLALASATGVAALNKFPASKQMTKNDETTYGMDVTHYTSPFGSLNLVYHKLLEGTKYGGVILVLDMEEVAYRYLANSEFNRDTKVLTNRQPNDQDGRKDEILTEFGLEFGLEATHGVLTGITS